jgi:hypothetical protein
MRVWLPDKPGSLGALATALGQLGADINAVKIADKTAGSALVDLVLWAPPDHPPESLVEACQLTAGVRVESISWYPEGGGLGADLETVEHMSGDPTKAAETLVTASPLVFRSHWALLLDVAVEPKVVFSTPRSPAVDACVLAGLAPFDSTHRVELRDSCQPARGACSTMVGPLGRDRAIVIGRLGGPSFQDSEVIRLSYLVNLVE